MLDGFSSKRTLENSQRFGVDQWLRLLTPFYDLAGYLSPPPYPSFTASLLDDLSNSADSIRLADLINRAEPLVAKQRITRTILEEWRDELEEEATELTQRGKAFGPTDDPNEFDEWRSTSEQFLATVEDFVLWGTAEPVKAVDELRKIFESSHRPREPEPEEDSEQRLPDSGPYWTVERLFEDL